MLHWTLLRANALSGAVTFLRLRVRAANLVQYRAIGILPEDGINSLQIWPVAVAGNLDSIGEPVSTQNSEN